MPGSLDSSAGFNEDAAAEGEEDDDTEDPDAAVEMDKDKTKAQLTNAIGEAKAKIDIITKQLEEDPVRMVLKEVVQAVDKDDAQQVEEHKQIWKDLKDYSKTDEFTNMSRKQLDYYCDMFKAQVAKVYVLPAQLRDAKSEVKRLEEAIKDKMLAEMEAKVEKAASRAKRSAEAGQTATTKRTKKATIVD